MEYKFSEIEEQIKKFWSDKNIYRVGDSESGKPKYYVLDMFPYPSGAGLHVGHPLGYIASDIYSRYKRMKGFNVLHPMGYDSFGLPAEQYAIQTGQHPAITTEQNIKRFREQYDKMGFCFDWSREVKTSDPEFYKWTQWIFIQLFNSWYNNSTDKAENISSLEKIFTTEGNPNVKAAHGELSLPLGESRSGAFFSANEWKNFSESEQQEILMQYRLAFLSEAYVNWCPALGTVLANDEVKDGVSERGGYPVERKLMKQWMLRITAYGERLLSGLNDLQWSESIKEAQRNWIGRSEGASVKFDVGSSKLEVKSKLEVGSPILEVNSSATITSKIQDQISSLHIEVFTTRPDTIFGVTFLTLAPEHELINQITPDSHKKEVKEYVLYAKNRSERERMTEVKKITGVFTGAYAIHPFTGKQIPVWIGEYVLAGYGTGAVMGVPGHDSRDYGFAKHFNLEIIKVVAPLPTSPPRGEEIGATEVLPLGEDLGGAFEGEGKNINSAFLDGLKTADAKKKVIDEIEKNKIGERKINFKLRDAVFGRQRYWGEPIPIYYDENNIPRVVDENDLPIRLPEVDKYLPTETGEPPLANAKNWKYKPKPIPAPSQREGRNTDEAEVLPLGEDLGGAFELTTMPGWAGSSWYLFRYMDPHNKNAFAGKDKLDYWKQVDFYIGGSEHATGHLMYFRFWTKFLKDLGLVDIEEPAKRLVNQGMIQGVSAKVFKNNFNFKTVEFAKKYIVFAEKYIHDKKLIENISDVFVCWEFASTDIKKFDLPVLFSEINLPIEYANFSKYNYNIDEFYNSGNNRAKNILFIFRGGVFLNGKFYFDEGVNNYEFKFTAIPEKMSKSKYNVVNPDDIIDKYGADCFRMYEMFLGPVEMSKPWDTKGIDGVSRFLRKLWKLFYSDDGKWLVTNEAATNDELKILHKTIKKVEDDIEKLSYNTSVSAFMICVNELTDLKCHKAEVLNDLLLILAPFAPFTTEFLWQKLQAPLPTSPPRGEEVGATKVLPLGEDLGGASSIVTSDFPKVREELLVENSFEYPIAINGKTKTKITFALDKEISTIEKEVLDMEILKKYFEGRAPKKIIVVKGKMINVVV